MPKLDQPFASGRTAELYAWEPGTVLKLFRSGFSPGQAEEEANASRLVCGLGIPAPAVIAVINHADRRGIVFQRISGSAMLETLSRQPWRIFALARTLAELQVNLHRQSAPGLPAYSSRLERDIRRAPDLPDDLRARALSALVALPSLDRLCHADFHPGNVLMTANGAVIIDWMTAASGSPWADAARTRLLLTIGEPPDDTPLRWLLQAARASFFRAYQARYQALLPDPTHQIQAWLPVIAAARLNENIIPERPALLRIIRAGLLP